MKQVLIFFFLVLTLITSSYAANDTLLVGVKTSDPFVILQGDGKVSGFSVDLMLMIAEELEHTPELEFLVDTDLQTHLDRVAAGEVDLGIAATTITSSRAEYLDFSHPFYESSLAIMLKEGSNKKSVFSVLLHKEVLILVGLILLLIFILAHIIWFVERKGRFKKWSYFPGIFSAFWWTSIALMPTSEAIEYDKLIPKTRISKLLSQTIVLVGILAFGLIFAKMTSAFTVSELGSTISGPEDLIGERVGVIVNTQSVEVTKAMGLQVIEVESFDKAIEQLHKGKLEALVYDKPLLQYYIRTQGKGEFYLVSETFAPNSYGIVFPQESELRNEIDIALLKVIESGKYDTLKAHWFE